MFHKLKFAIQLRVLLVSLMVHIGLILGVFGIARTSGLNGWDTSSALFLGAVSFLYGGIVLGTLFIVSPLLPWIKPLHTPEHWSERVIRDLPLLLEQLPKIIIGLQGLKKSLTTEEPSQPNGSTPPATE